MWGAKNKFLSFCLRRKTFSSLHITFQGPPFSVSCARGKKSLPSPPDLSSARAIGRERELSRQKARLARAGEGFLRALYRGMAFTNYRYMSVYYEKPRLILIVVCLNSLLYFPSPCCDSFGNSPFSTAFYPTVSPPEDTESERIFLLLSLFLFPPEGES